MPVVQPADPDRLPLPHDDLHGRREGTPERGVAHPGRRQQALAPAVQIGPDQTFAAQSAEHRQDLAFRQSLVAADDDAIHSQHVRLRHATRSEVGAVRQHEDGEHVPERRPDRGRPSHAGRARA